MKKINLTLLIFLIGLFVVPPLLSRAQQNRGQGVRVKVSNGPEVALYDASYALVIGISNYTGGWPDLPGVRDDLPAVKTVLEKHGFQVTTVLNPTRQQFDAAMRDFLARYGQGRKHRLLIYFAGHGHTLRTSDQRRELGYIVPADAASAANPGEFKRLAISMSEVNTYAEQIEAGHALFVFDSCFAGSIFKSRSGVIPEAITDKILHPVRQFITAGSAAQTVPDRSYFRRAFVAALEGAADDNHDGFITGTELGEYLHREVTGYTRRAQIPQHGKLLNPDLNEGDLVFVAPKRGTVTIIDPPPVDPAAIDLALWQSAQRNDDVADYEEYLRQYPNGRFANLARNRIARLRPADTPPKPNPAPNVRMSVAGVPLAAMSFTTVNTDARGNVINQRQEQCWGYVEDINGVKLQLVEIPAGSFMMGSPNEEAGRVGSEGPQHRVKLKGFLMGKTEVTQAQWRAVTRLPKVKIDLNPDPAHFKGDDLPVEQVSWDEAVEFCERLSRKTGGRYRLPSEAEWEYAARAGTTTPFAFGATISPAVVNYKRTFLSDSERKKERNKTVAAGSLPANGWGLHEMHGNVWEWCLDIWHENYNGAPSDGSAWLETGSDRVFRGGGWDYDAADCRSALRALREPGLRDFYLGFRLLRQ